MTDQSDIVQERAVMAAGALARHADGDLTRISGLTDEEVLALVGPDDASSFDLPWITAREARDPGYSRSEARLSALRSLIVRGGVTKEPVMAAVEERESGSDPTAFTPSALLTGILTRRSLSPYVLRVSGPDQDETTILRVFVDSDGSVLHELISPDGLHHFFMSDLEHAGVSILGRIDPDHTTSDVAQDGEVVTGSWAALEQDPTIGPVLATVATRSLLEIEDRRNLRRQEIVIAVGPAGTAVIRSAGTGDALEAVLAPRGELEDFVRTLLEPEDQAS